MPVEEIVFDFIEECEMPLMKVDSDTDVEEDIPFAGPSRNCFLMKPRSFCSSSRNMKNRDNKCRERALRLVYDDSWNLHFWEILVKGNSVSMHQKSLQTLVAEIFKAKQGISPEISSDLLQFVKRPYNIRNNYMVQRKKDKAVYFVTERI